MKKILKYIAVLLVLFALIGTASAEVRDVQIIVTDNGINYDVDITWKGDATGSLGITFDVIFDGGTPYTVIGTDVDIDYSIPTISGYSLTTGTVYVATVDDGAGSDGFDLYMLAPNITSFSTETDITDLNNFSITLELDGTLDANVALQLYNGSGWEPITAPYSAYPVNGNAISNFAFRFNFDDSSNVTSSSNTTFSLASAPTINSPPASAISSDSITWTFTTSGWPFYEYIVVETLPPYTVIDDNNTTVSPIDINGLDPNTQYTLYVRGVSELSPTPNTTRSLWKTNTATTDFAELIIPGSFVPGDYYNFSKGEDQGNFSIENATTFKLNLTTTSASKFEWTLLYDNSGTNETVKTETTLNSTMSEFSWKPSKTGQYYLKLKITDDTTPSLQQNLSWNLSVTEKSTGNRIWQDGMPTTYTWDARSFAGFYYDLDTGYGSESMTIKNIGRSIGSGNISYTTTASNVSYAYDRWGNYSIVGFMGDKYYAGSGSSSLMSNGNLSKVLIDDNVSKNYRVGQVIALEEGYSVEINQINTQGSSAFLVVMKDGKQVGSGIVNAGTGGDFSYNISAGRTNFTLIRVHVSNVFMGTESSLVSIDGIFQVSDNLTKLESGTKIGKMEIKSVAGGIITMENFESVSLSQDSEITLMGKMKFIVADSATLRFAPIIEYTDPGTYEIRGTVSDFANDDYIVYEWTPMNFEGFYYDINDDISDSERITILNHTTLSNSSRRIASGDVVYTSNVTTVSYKYGGWNEYDVIGFMGEKYFAGINGSLIKSGNLSKVLIDEDEKRMMRVGQYITLEEGYAIRIDQININGNSAYFVLEKDGRKVDEGIVRSGDDYVYERNISNTKVELVKVHVDSVFMGTESSLISISGIFQASDQLTKLERGAKYGKMVVEDYTPTGFNMKSNESITLSAGNDVDLMKVGNDSIYFKVGDNDTLRFAPCVEKVIGSDSPLKIEFSPNRPVAGDYITITVNDRGTTLEGVTVSVNNSSIGTTNSSGQIGYSTSMHGTYRVTADKTGYVSGNETLIVDEKLLNMVITVMPDTNLTFGTTGTIKVTDSLNGSAVSDVTIRLSSEEIGRTNSAGELSYTFNSPGSFTIQASKSGYINATRDISVTQKDAFNYSGFQMKPDSPTAKSNIKLTFDATNVGVEDGSHTVKLVLRDSSGAVIAEDSKTVSVNVNKTKSVTLSVKPPAEGSYTLTLMEEDSNRVINLPSHMSSVSVGESKLFGSFSGLSTIVYGILAVAGIIVIVIVGAVAYLFGVKGATKENYKIVAGDIVDDFKAKFRKK
ncbi:MAG: hypothetical protein FWE78_00390 [Methanimicrococcus sp.]|nr:hypothetical protein [Methanimicrococcus sp.]